TGQPEIIALGAGIKETSDAIGSALKKAKKVRDIGRKVKHHISAMKHKKSLSDALRGAGDILVDVGNATGHSDLTALAGHMKDAADVTDKAINHGKSVIKRSKGLHKHIKKGDVAGVIGGAQVIGKELAETKKIAKMALDIIKKAKKGGSSHKSGHNSSHKPEKSAHNTHGKGVPKGISLKTGKKKRVSAYNLHVKRVLLEGGTMMDAGREWRLLKSRGDVK
ncbi:MAG: hypothetical protein IH795_10825, partial [Bacteroidetes bacterium]|nr:hypothetical protein [Bacteroidota bacterium]